MEIEVKYGLPAILETLEAAARELELYDAATFALVVRQAAHMLQGASLTPTDENAPPTIIDRIADALAETPVPQLRKAPYAAGYEIGHFEATPYMAEQWRQLAAFEDAGEAADALERARWSLLAVSALNTILRALEADGRVAIPMADGEETIMERVPETEPADG